MSLFLVITGPTASGKTAEALRLAEQWQVPVINADSRQIYRDLPIGTAAPTAEEQARVPHFFVGTHGLNETYNAGQFARDAEQVLQSLAAAREADGSHSSAPLQSACGGSPPLAIVCGGSMLYIDALCHGLDDIPSVPAELRQAVQAEYEDKGLAWLQTQVAEHDPEYWQRVDRQNPRRLLHCLELCRLTGQPYSALLSSRHRTEGTAEFQLTVLSPPREELYERINARVTRMVEAGLLDEADRAFRLTLGEDYRSLSLDAAMRLLPNSLNTVGYKELLPFFLRLTTLDEALDRIRLNTRHYAKRQMTWWRGKHTT